MRLYCCNYEHKVYQVWSLLNVRDATREESGVVRTLTTARLEYLAMLGSTHSCNTSETRSELITDLFIEYFIIKYTITMKL